MFATYIFYFPTDFSETWKNYCLLEKLITIQEFFGIIKNRKIYKYILVTFMVLWDHLLYNLLNNISEFYPLLKSFDSFLQNKGALQNVQSMEEFL